MGQEVTLSTTPNAEYTKEHQKAYAFSSNDYKDVLSQLVKNTTDLSADHALIRSHFQIFKGENTRPKTYIQNST